MKGKPEAASDERGRAGRFSKLKAGIRDTDIGASLQDIVITIAMLEILKHGLIESGDQVSALAQSYGQVVIPNEDEDLDLTHWWIIRDDGVEALYVGTEETFATYVKERTGGLQ